ncbi:hypothetical protein D3C80_1396630 [compost metagenome]
MHAGDQILAGLAQKLFGHSYRQTRKIPPEQAAFLHSRFSPPLTEIEQGLTLPLRFGRQ